MNQLFLVVQREKLKLINKDDAQKIYVKLSKQKDAATQLTKRISSIIVAQASMMIENRATSNDKFKIGDDVLNVDELYQTARAMLENIFPLFSAQSKNAELLLDEKEIMKGETILSMYRKGEINEKRRANYLQSCTR